MQSRRTFLTTTWLGLGALALSAAAPAFGDAPSVVKAQISAVADGYVVSSQMNASQSARLSAQAGRLEQIFRGTGATVVRRKGEVIVHIPEQVLFAHPKPSVRPDAMPLLTALAAEMIDHSGTWLEIMAHYHSDGRAANSMASSERRGVAVQAVLMSRQVPLSRVVVSGLGEAYPAETNRTPQGRSANRRIELVFRAL